jgi:hypothetical protein
VALRPGVSAHRQRDRDLHPSVIYHRLQYPDEDWEKFQARCHFFILAGTPMLAGGVYLSMALAMWPRWEGASLAVALLPLLVAAAVYGLRRRMS